MRTLVAALLFVSASLAMAPSAVAGHRRAAARRRIAGAVAPRSAATLHEYRLRRHPHALVREPQRRRRPPPTKKSQPTLSTVLPRPLAQVGSLLLDEGLPLVPPLRDTRARLHLDTYGGSLAQRGARSPMPVDSAPNSFDRYGGAGGGVRFVLWF